MCLLRLIFDQESRLYNHFPLSNAWPIKVHKFYPLKPGPKPQILPREPGAVHHGNHY